VGLEDGYEDAKEGKGSIRELPFYISLELGELLPGYGLVRNEGEEFLKCLLSQDLFK